MIEDFTQVVICPICKRTREPTAPICHMWLSWTGLDDYGRLLVVAGFACDQGHFWALQILNSGDKAEISWHQMRNPREYAYDWGKDGFV
jgi:hypothetical protein